MIYTGRDKLFKNEYKGGNRQSFCAEEFQKS
jgi:hypothetical protein